MDYGNIFDEKTLKSIFPDASTEQSEKSGFDPSALDDFDSVIENLTIDTTKTMYIICEKQGFRTDSLNTALSDEYRTKRVFTSVDPKPEYENPLCFVVDVTQSNSNMISQKSLIHIQNSARKSNVPIFLIGEPEDLSNVDYLFKEFECNVTRFERPINLKQCIADITNVLMFKKNTDKKRICIVDDSIMTLRLVQRTLGQNPKYQIMTCSSAYDCISKIATLGENETIDAFILDFRMPLVDGYTLCQMLREQEQFKDTLIIFYSGNDSKDVNEIIQLMSVGIDGYILKTKPISSLESYLDEIFEKKRHKSEKTIA